MGVFGCKWEAGIQGPLFIGTNWWSLASSKSCHPSAAYHLGDTVERYSIGNSHLSVLDITLDDGFDAQLLLPKFSCLLRRVHIPKLDYRIPRMRSVVYRIWAFQSVLVISEFSSKQYIFPM